MIICALHEFARACNLRESKRVSLLRIAVGCAQYCDSGGVRVMSGVHRLRALVVLLFTFLLSLHLLRYACSNYLEAVMNLIRNGLEMWKTANRSKLGQLENPHSNRVFTKVHNTL
jgi:hypothetical protein